MSALLPRCVKCRRHLRASCLSCPFCARRPYARVNGAALAASLMAFGCSAEVFADERIEGVVVVPSSRASPAQDEPMYGMPPEPPPEPEPEPEPPSDEESPPSGG